MHLIDMKTRFFGLTTNDLRQLLFEIVGKKNVNHSFYQDFRMAGK